MNKINVCAGLFYSSHPLCTSLEEIYSSVYRKLATFLYANPDFPFCFYFSGLQLEWLEKKHQEFFAILKELCERKQLEILGGGYYNPVFPLLLPVDRVGQTELLTTAVRRAAGRRPRGVLPAGSVWDPSLILTFNTCGMEFVLLDSGYTNSGSKPLIIEDMGKTLIVLPYNSGLSADFDCPPEEFYAKILAAAGKNENAFVCCLFDAEKIAGKITSDWLARLFELLRANPAVDFTLPSRFIKTNQHYEKTFLASGASPFVLSRFEGKPFAHKNTVRNFLLEYPEALQLYSKMMYTSLLVNQCRGDRARKKNAREELWKSQNASSYWFLGSDGVTNQKLRRQSYRHLLTAEKIVRGAGNFIPSAVSLDFDMDGNTEYLFQFNSYNFVVSPYGAHVFEFDSLSGARNYADTSRRSLEYDGVEDSYPRKMFVDHFVDEAGLALLYSGATGGLNTIFPLLRYQEVSFDRTKREVQFRAAGLFGSQEILLRKKYSASASGVQVQYILKNESPELLVGYFAVEQNIAFHGTDAAEQKIEAVMDSSLRDINPAEPFYQESGAAYLELTDLCSPCSFIYEINEEAGLFLAPLNITRPVCGKNTTTYQATTCTFFWRVEVPPGREVEKTITLGIKMKRKQQKISPA